MFFRFEAHAIGVALAGIAALLLLPGSAAAAGIPAACPPHPTRVVRSAGGTIDYVGTVPGIPELCRLRDGDGEAEFYFGLWRSDWPGAGQAYPAKRAAIFGPKGTRTSFVTRAIPGQQWTDTFTNEGIEPVAVDGRTYQTLRLAHERQGIEGSTYHSIITAWRDIETGVLLKVVEDQIAGQSYGPDTTWTAVRVEALP